MWRKLFAIWLCLPLLSLGGCKKAANNPSSQSQAAASPVSAPGTNQTKFDCCGLMTKDEIEAIQGSPITSTTSSGRSGQGLFASQCYYAAAESSRSVSLEVTQSDSESPAKRSAKDFWKETFDQHRGEENQAKRDEDKKETGRGKEEEGKSIPPKKINDVGDEAYWIGSRVGGALYVLKGDAFIRISVGGRDNAETKINKSRALAQKALQRL